MATLAAAIWVIVSLSPGFADADRALGEFLSGECVTCHQLSGKYAGIPPIVGWPTDTFIDIMNTYRDKTRANEIMQTIANRFSPAEIAALAAYFSDPGVAPPKK